MVDIGKFKKANRGMAFRMGLERFDLVTPLTQRGVPVNNAASRNDNPAQR